MDNAPGTNENTNENETRDEAYEEMIRLENIVKKREGSDEVFDWVKTILLGFFAGLIMVLFVVQRNNVQGESMMPTLNSGDVIFTQKISTYIGDYERGDIVIVNATGLPGYTKQDYIVKRIVGMPGETVRIADGCVYIKPADSDEFYILKENYLAEGTATYMMAFGESLGFDEVTLGDDEYYCLGDNRTVSNDSRNMGPMSEDRIVAIAFLKVYPFDEIGTL